MKNSQKISTEDCHFYRSEKSLGREKSLYIVWACFRNDIILFDFLKTRLT